MNLFYFKKWIKRDVNVAQLHLLQFHNFLLGFPEDYWLWILRTAVHNVFSAKFLLVIQYTCYTKVCHLGCLHFSFFQHPPRTHAYIVWHGKQGRKKKPMHILNSASHKEVIFTLDNRLRSQLQNVTALHVINLAMFAKQYLQKRQHYL